MEWNFCLGPKIITWADLLFQMKRFSLYLFNKNSIFASLFQGNSRIILDYKPHQHAHRTGAHGPIHEIHFHESLWHNRQSPQFPVSRDLLMVALQNLQHLLIRGHTHPMPSHLQISHLAMEVAGSRQSERGSTSLAGGRPALGVELCECPTGYNGSSCQSAATGYYRKHAPDALDHIDHFKLLGESVPCDCHNHSKECDGQSGRCLNCQHNTEGMERVEKPTFLVAYRLIDWLIGLLFCAWIIMKSIECSSCVNSVVFCSQS